MNSQWVTPYDFESYASTIPPFLLCSICAILTYMKKLTNTIIYILIILLLGAGLYYYFGHGLLSKNPYMYGSNEADGIVKGYMHDILPHHIKAVEVSKFIMNDSEITIPEVRVLAANMADSQEFEISQLKNWYVEWFNSPVPFFLYKSPFTETDKTGDARAKIYLRDMIKHARYEAKQAHNARAYIEKIQKNNSSTDGDLTITNSHPGIDTIIVFTKEIEEKKAKEIEEIEAVLRKF